MTTSHEMPKYQCHKKVWALKIKAVAQGTQPTDLPGGSWMLHPADDGYGPLEVSHEWYAKHKPEAGGYFVVYDDGYKSYSPASAFESGYSLIPPASTHQQRVLDEKRELDERLSKLDAFILDNPLSLQLSGSEQERLARQSKAMAIYSGILGERIAAF